MHPENPGTSIQEQIAAMEQQRINDLHALRAQFHLLTESLKPSKLFIGTIEEVASSPVVRSTFRKAMIGLLIAFVAKKILSRKSAKPSKGLFRSALDMGINLLIANRYALLKSAGALVLSALVTNLKSGKARKQTPVTDNSYAPARAKTVPVQ